MTARALATVCILAELRRDVRALGLSPDRAQAFEQFLAGAAALLETGSRPVAQTHACRAHEALAMGLHDETVRVPTRGAAA